MDYPKEWRSEDLSPETCGQQEGGRTIVGMLMLIVSHLRKKTLKSKPIDILNRDLTALSPFRSHPSAVPRSEPWENLVESLYATD